MKRNRHGYDWNSKTKMKLKTKYFFPVLFFCFSSLILLSQKSKIDSLQNILNTAKQDTTRLSLYLALCDECETKDNLKYAVPALKLADKLLSQATNDKARKSILKQKAGAFDCFQFFYSEKKDTSKILEYQQKKLTIYKEIKDTASIAQSILGICNWYLMVGNIPKALESCQEGLSTCQEMNYENGISVFLSRMGQMYADQGDLTEALVNYQKSLSLAYELKDTLRTANILILIGNIYADKHNVINALGSYNKSISLLERIKVKGRTRLVYNRIGLMYEMNNDLPNALKNFEKSISVANEMNSEEGVAASLNFIGRIYARQGNLVKAYDYHLKALLLSERLSDEYNLAWSYENLSNIYMKQKKYKEAKYYCDRSIEIKKKFPSVSLVRDAELLASQVDSASGNYRGAYDHYQQYIILRDKLKSEEVHKSATKEKFQSEYDNQKRLDKADQEKKDALAAEEKRKQKNVIWGIICSLLLAIGFAGFVFRSLQVTRKQKQLIEIKSRETELQKQIIEEKKQEITDSINYAQNIQRSILPPLIEIRSALPNSFVLFKPKDIVSGDFYWFSETGDKILIAAADCTGHGVPGAFMSTIGSEKLNEAVKDTNDVSDVLNLVNRGMRKVLRQSEKMDSTRDGMDIALCAFNKEMTQVEYAGANRPIWIVRKNPSPLERGRGEAIEETKATKVAIAGLTEDDQEFTKHTIDLQKGDNIYIFTDGYADQFSPQNKKLMTRKFKELILSVQNKTMEEQRVFLASFIDDWKGNMEQTDDILVIGVRI